MKRKDLYNYIKEEIVVALTEAGEKTAMVTTQSGKTSAVDYRTSDELNRIKDNTDIKSIETGTGQKIKEMANIVSKIKIQDPAKFALAKEVYSSGRTGALLDALSTASEEGMTQKELGTALGLKNDSELNSIINNLRIAGVLSPKREKTVKPEKPTPEVEPELPTLTPDEEPEKEPVDTYYKDEEETPEEEPTAVNDKELEKTVGKTYADLTPEEEKTYGTYRQAIVNKAKILNDKKASKDDKAKAKAAIDKYKTNADLKKLFNKKGIDLIKFINSELNG